MTDDDVQPDAGPQIVDVTITAPDADWLRQHCAMLIEKRLAASANIIPAIDSIYRWQGEVHQATEAYAIVHTEMAHFAEIASLTEQNHPYDVSHIISSPTVLASEPYIDWVLDSTSPNLDES